MGSVKGSQTGNPDLVFQEMSRYYSIPLAAPVYLAVTIAISPVNWVFKKLIDLPYDFVYHLENDKVFQELRDDMPWLYSILATVHFFLPLEALIPGRHQEADQLGILSFTQPALGRTGLNKYLRNRFWWFPDVKELKNFVDPTTDQGPTVFCNLAETIYRSSNIRKDITLMQNRVYSFDASMVYNSWWPPLVGAHSDLSSLEKTTCGDYELRKAQFSFNFLYNFTKVLPISSP